MRISLLLGPLSVVRCSLPHHLHNPQPLLPVYLYPCIPTFASIHTPAPSHSLIPTPSHLLILTPIQSHKPTFRGFCPQVMRRDGISRGFGFIVFSSDHEAAMCLAQPGHMIDGKAVECKVCGAWC